MLLWFVISQIVEVGEVCDQNGDRATKVAIFAVCD